MTLKFWQLRRPSVTTYTLVALAFLTTILGAIVPAQAQTYNINFPAPSTFVATAQPNCPNCTASTDVAVGDFNGDGKLDVVTLGNQNSLDVAMGNGDGTFQTPVYTYIGAPCYGAYAITVGDFNGDKIPDVGVWGANCTSGLMQLNIYLGTGNGNFTTGPTYNPAGSNNWNPLPSTIVAEDVNGDGKVDIIALTQYNGVFVFLGNGDGTFQTPANYPATDPVGGSDGGVAVADVNGDGHPDIVVQVAQGIDVLLNNGNGTFAAAVYYNDNLGNCCGQGGGIAIGDVNGDKKPDVVITSPSEGVTVFLNKGSGTFAVGSQIVIPNIYSASNIFLADINNDKKLDIVVPDAFGNVYTFLGNGKGTFTAGANLSLEVYGGTSLIAVADFNGDGTLDVLQAMGNDFTNSVSFGRGDGTFRTAQFYNYTGPSQAQNMVVADFNGDGFADVAAQGIPAGTIGVILDNSHGTLTAKPSYINACSNEYVYGIAAGDVSGDGKQDLVASLGGTSTTCNHMVAVMIGKGTGKFANPVYYPTGAATNAQEMQIYLVDVNGDGHPDIVTSNDDGSISVLLNKGKGTFAAPVLITSLVTATEEDNTLTFGDFNGDGKLDIAVAANPARTNDQSVYVLPGNGDGTFGTPIGTNTGYFLSSLVAGDFNNDGKQDLFVTTTNWGCSGGVGGVPYGSAYLYLQGNGAGSFSVGPQNCLLWANASAPVATDFNADGNLDVAVPYQRNEYTNGVAVFQGNGKGAFTANQIYYPGYAIAALGVGDFNGDGMPDLAMVNFDSYFSILLNETQPVSLSPLKVNFGSVTVAAKKTATVILTNDQSTTLSITSMTIGGADPGDFKQTNKCSTSRKPGWNCTITVTFTPTATGARSATLTVKDGVGSQVVQLNGTGK